MNAELLEPSDPRWRGVLEKTAHNAYQLPEYAQLCARAHSGTAVGLYLRAGAGEVLIPLILRELPALGDAALEGWRDATSPYGYPGVVVAGTPPPEALQSCVLGALLHNRVLCAFIRADPFSRSGEALLRALGGVVPSGEMVYLDLRQSEELLWMAARPEHRREIRRLRDAGYTPRRDDWADFPGFKALYAAAMRRVGARAFYHFDDRYFDGLKAALGEWLHLFSVIGPDGELVSAGVCFEGADGVVHGHLSGAVSSMLAATKMQYDAEWRWAKSRGAHSYNLGGGMGRPNDSLLFFKQGFSRTLQRFHTARLVCAPDLYQRACAAAGVAGDLSGYFPAYRDPSSPTGSAASRSARVTG